MGMSSGISGLYDGLFSMSSSIIGSIMFSTPYTYPAQILFLYFAYRISKSYLKTMIELVRLSTKNHIFKAALSKSPMINHFQEVV